MRKLPFLLLFLTVAVFAQAQIATNIYWVQFTDKTDSPYSIDNPEAYLSPRALQRRANLGIAIDEYDIPVNPQYLQAVANCGAELINPSKWLNGVTVHVTDPSVTDAIHELAFVSTVRNCPNDLKAQEQKQRWIENEMRPVTVNHGSRGYYGGADDQVKQLKVNVMHDMGYDGYGVVVAVLDGGFVGTDAHSCFDNMREEGRLLGVRDYVYGSTTVYSQTKHGTACLSTMAAYAPNTMVGTAPKASYYLIHTEDYEQENIVEEYNWVSGAEYADSLGVDVCSTSLNYFDFDMPQWNHPFEHYDGHTAPMTIGAEIAASRGMICVNSAGNNGSGTCTIGIPGDAEHILTIGAVNAEGQRAGFSSVGPTYDGRVKPDVMAMGEGTYVAVYSSDYPDYHNGNGTSFATPVLAGAVACLRQAYPYASVQEICEVVRQCGNRADNPNSYYGYGIPDFSKAIELLATTEPAEPSAGDVLSVYPNPSQGEVHVMLNQGANAEVTVFDITGRQLFNYHFNGLNHSSLENHLNNLVSGVYFINAVSEVGNQTLKLVITK
jgi:subtilisin family serine protease